MVETLQPSNDALRARVLALVSSLGVSGAARRLDSTNEIIARVCGSLPVRRGTAMQLEVALERYEAAQSALNSTVKAV